MSIYHISGFVSRSSLANNDRRVVAPLGELSLRAGTFARDRLIFTDPTKPKATLVVYESIVSENGVTTGTIPVPTAIKDLSLTISDYLYNLSDAGDIPSNQEALLDIIRGQFGLEIRNVELGAQVTNGFIRMPSYITWEGTSGALDYRAQYWFADEAFQTQYHGYEITVVPFLDDYDALFGTLDGVSDLIDAQNTSVAITDRIRIAADDDPYTDIRTNDYQWTQPGRSDITRMIPISALVYGDAGNNPDLIRRAIADHILANSNYDEDAWREIMPDIFSPTEFLFLPAWNRYSIPSGTILDYANGEYPVSVTSAGAYMPGGNVAQQILFAQELSAGTGYTDEYVAGNLNLVNFMYKSIQVAVLGGHRNRLGVTQFLNRWPDYIAVGTGTLDFQRMSDETKDMAILINEMLHYAEEMSAISILPRKFMKVVRDGKLFLAADFKRTQLLVLSRASVATVYQYTTGSDNVPVQP